jgi:ABC-type polysaccharide/polyol phosphate transport system ATPase subunit
VLLTLWLPSWAAQRTGPAHAGKSTLMGLISGHLQPTKGHITRNPKVGDPIIYIEGL